MYFISLLKPKVALTTLFLWNASLGIAWYFFGRAIFGLVFGILCLGIGIAALAIRKDKSRIFFFYLILEESRKFHRLKTQLKIIGLFFSTLGFATLLIMWFHFY